MGEKSPSYHLHKHVDLIFVLFDVIVRYAALKPALTKSHGPLCGSEVLPHHPFVCFSAQTNRLPTGKAPVATPRLCCQSLT